MASQTQHSAESPAAHRARGWRATLPSAHRSRSTARGLWYFTRSASIYVALFAGAFLLPYWWMRLACLVALPFIIGALFVIGHDAAHHSLTPSRRLNRICGRLALLPALHPFTSWSHAHNRLHHGGTCLKGIHPDFAPLSKDEYDQLPAWQRRLQRVFRSPLGVGLAYACEFYVGYLLFPNERKRSPLRTQFHRDRALVLGFFVLQLWVGYVLAASIDAGAGSRVARAVAFVVGPWAAWLYLMGVATFVQHTHPRTAWYDNESEWTFYHVQLRSSTHMVLHWPLGSALHHIMDHPAHHLDPTIPLYELSTSQQLLEEQAPDDSVVVRLTWLEYLRICRVCKLYDYRRHGWLDFDGRPTTHTGLHGLDDSEPTGPLLAPTPMKS